MANWHSASEGQQAVTATDYRRWWDSLHDPVLSALVEEAFLRTRTCGSPACGSSRPRPSSALPSLLGPRRRWGQRNSSRQVRPATATAARAAAAAPASASAGSSTSWGKFQRGVEAADASYFATLAQYDDIQVLMAAQVAQLYVSIPYPGGQAAHRPGECPHPAAQPEITERLFRAATAPSWTCSRPGPSTWAPSPAFPSSRPACARARTPSPPCSPAPRVPCPRWRRARGAIPGSWRWSPRCRGSAAPPSRCAGGGRQLAAQSALIGGRERGSTLHHPARHPGGQCQWRGEWYLLLGRRALAQLESAGSGTLGKPDPGAGRPLPAAHERYRDSVFKAAREVDDGVAYANGREIALLTQTGEAARRALGSPAPSIARGWRIFSGPRLPARPVQPAGAAGWSATGAPGCATSSRSQGPRRRLGTGGAPALWSPRRVEAQLRPAPTGLPCSTPPAP